MIDLIEIEQYLEHVKDSVEAIKTTRLVIDDSHINEVLRELKESDNLLLLGLIPSHQTDGQDVDDVTSKDIMAILVLKKADRKIKYSDFIANMHTCQQAAKQIRLKLMGDMEAYNDGCSFLSMLNVPSISIDPIYGLGGADGYEINFNFNTHIA